MKKLIVLALLLSPFTAFADFQSNLHYGSTGTDVVALQEFLANQGVFSGQATGNFYSITLAAVKLFQQKEGITPVSGYVGPVTRGIINGLLAVQAPDSEGDATTTQATVDLSTLPPTVPPKVVYVPVYTPPAPVQTNNGGTIGSNPQPMPTPVPDRIVLDYNSPVANPQGRPGIANTPFLITVSPLLSDGSLDESALVTVTSNAPWWFPRGARVCTYTITPDIQSGKIPPPCQLMSGVQFNAFGSPTGAANSAGSYSINATWEGKGITASGTITVQEPPYVDNSNKIEALKTKIYQRQQQLIRDIASARLNPVPIGDQNATVQKLNDEAKIDIDDLQNQINQLL